MRIPTCPTTVLLNGLGSYDGVLPEPDRHTPKEACEGVVTPTKIVECIWIPEFQITDPELVYGCVTAHMLYRSLVR